MLQYLQVGNVLCCSGRFLFVFNNEIINPEILGNITFGYWGFYIGFSDCHIITMEPQHYGDEPTKKIPHLRFIFRSDNFVTTQQLVYMPDGSEYKDSIGVVTNLEGNWYYQTTTLIE